MKLAPVATVLLIACSGPSRAVPRAPAATLPDARVERQLRLEAAAYLGCSAAATRVERTSWQRDRGQYLARGCGFEVVYVVACDAPDRCGFTPAP